MCVSVEDRVKTPGLDSTNPYLIGLEPRLEPEPEQDQSAMDQDHDIELLDAPAALGAPEASETSTTLKTPTKKGKGKQTLLVLDKNNTDAASTLEAMSRPGPKTSTEALEAAQEAPRTPTQKGGQGKRKLVPVIPLKRDTNYVFSAASPDHLLDAPRPCGLTTTRAIKEKIQAARQLIVEAASLSKTDPEEQTRLLDLVEVFREYTERKPLSSATKTISAQVANLGTVVTKIERATRQQGPQAKAVPPPPALQKGVLPHATTAPSYASAVGNTQPVDRASFSPSPSASEWVTVQRKAPTSQTQPAQPTQLVLSLPNKDQPIDSFQTRNRINNAYKAKGYKDILTLSATRSLKGNLVLKLASKAAKDYIVQNPQALKEAVPYTAILEDSNWFKVVAHGVPSAAFLGDNGPRQIQEEVETFNAGLKVVSLPIWLSSQETRATKNAGSVLLAFETEAEATRAITQRLFLGGVSVWVEKAKDKQRPALEPTHNSNTRGLNNTSTC